MNLSTELDVRNPGALAQLEERGRRMGVGVDEIQATLAATLPHLISAEYDPAGSDNQVTAALRDIVDRLRRQFRRQERNRSTTVGSGGATSSSGGGGRSGSASSGGDPPSRAG